MQYLESIIWDKKCLLNTVSFKENACWSTTAEKLQVLV